MATLRPATQPTLDRLTTVLRAFGARSDTTLTDALAKIGAPCDPADPNRAGMVPQQVVQIVEAVSDSIAAEIQRSLDFYVATSGEAP